VPGQRVRGGTRPRHRRTRALFPVGRHRATDDQALRWGLPLVVAAGIVVTVAAVLVVADLLLG